MPSTPPILAGLYVHVPFCSAICPYCDFAVLVGTDAKRQAFVHSLSDEISLRADEIRALGAIDTVYFGGGTPSLLPRGDLESILDAIRQTATLAADTRVFLEANPEDVDEARLTSWRALGIHTLTLGVQALDDDALRFLGRRHNAADARRAVRLALEAGFETVSFDLIYGLPGQSVQRWRRTLDQAVELGPQHLSCYQLTIEPRTFFARAVDQGTLVPVVESIQAELFRCTHEHLRAHGYSPYEVSNFARGHQHRSRHNQKYWHHVPYVGLGPSAHSFDGRSRSWNERHLARWQQRLRAGDTAIAGCETLGPHGLALEIVMLGLRTTAGIDLGHCQRRFGFDLAAGNRGRIDRWVADGLLIREGDRLRPTLSGLAVADTLASTWQLPEPIENENRSS
jgi:oxygen-independent coproporphyrinogen-3 oxidase